MAIPGTDINGPRPLAAVESTRAITPLGNARQEDVDRLVRLEVGKQFQAAEDRKARFALVFGAEYPEVVIKNLLARSQSVVPVGGLVEEVQRLLAEPAIGPLIA